MFLGHLDNPHRRHPSPVQAQVFRGPVPMLCPCRALPWESVRVPSLQERPQDEQGTITALLGLFPQGLVPLEPSSPVCHYLGLQGHSIKWERKY